jgi:hypothetical protein
MKLGTENKKKTIFASVLLGCAVIVAVWQLWPSTPSDTPAAATVASKPASAISADPTALPPAHISARDRERRHVSATLAPSLDPRLRLDMLKGSEDLKYDGTGHNIFQEHAEDAIPTPLGKGLTDAHGGPTGTATAASGKTPWTPKEIPPPPITLKFYGWASAPGETKAIFLSQGDAVFIAHEGDVIARRYKIGKISNTEVEIEDVLSNNKEKIKLTHDNS